MYYQIKYTEAILSNGSRKLLWFEITKILIAVEKNYCVIFRNFRHTFVPCAKCSEQCVLHLSASSGNPLIALSQGRLTRAIVGHFVYLCCSLG